MSGRADLPDQPLTGEERSFVGRRLVGRFEVIGVIASTDGYCKLRCRDLDGTELVATACCAPPPGPERDAWYCVLAARHLAHHPRLARVLFSGEEPELDLGFIVEPRRRAQNLGEQLGDPLPFERCLRLASQLAGALDALATAGGAHGQVSARAISAAGVDHLDFRLYGGGLLILPEAPSSVTAPEHRGVVSVPTPAGDVWSLGALLEAQCGGEPREEWRGLLDEMTAAEPSRRPSWAVVLERVERLVERTRVGGAPSPPLAATRPTGRPAASTCARSANRALHGRAGELIGDRYRLTELIGEGGLGIVYEATNPDGELVAVKLLRFDEPSDSALYRFGREVRSLIRVHSPHVVKVLAADVDGPIPYLVMERLSGRDLAQALRETGPLDPGVAVRLFVELAEGLEAVHEAGLVHRDIKPSNVYLHREGDRIIPKLCDFGLAKLWAHPTDSESAGVTHTGGIVGSPAYMSPEQAQDGKRADARSDQFSLAHALYHALSGAPAWHSADNVGEIMLRLFTEDVPPLQDAAPWVPAGVASVVHTALDREPSRRFASVQAFKEALEPYAAPGPLTEDRIAGIDAERRGRVAPRAKLQWKRRWGRPAIAWSAAASLALGAVAYAAWPRHPAPAPGEEGEDGPAAPCETNLECSERLGVDARCHGDGTCGALAHERCKVLASPSVRDDPGTLWLGAMFPVASEDRYYADFGEHSHNAVELAIRDFNEVAGGIPSPGGTGRRPLGLVSCDDSHDAADVATHLAKEARVEAVIGFLSSRDVLGLSSSVFLPNDVLVVPALNGSSLITDIPNAADGTRMVFRTASSGHTYSPAVGEVLTSFLAPRAEAPGAPSGARVVILRLHDATGLAFAAEVREHLGRRFAVSEVGFEEDEKAPTALANRAAARSVINLDPTFIVSSRGGSRFVEEVMAEIEAHWPAGRRPPRYLIRGSLEGEALASLVGKHRGLAERLYGVATAAQTEANRRFTDRYNAAFRTELTPELAPSAPYDSVYLIAYAAAATSPGESRGRALARAIGRLVPPGQRVEVGPTSIPEALRRLGNGENIDLAGAFSPMDFDLETGESASDLAVVCATVDSKGGLLAAESGLVYLGSAGRLDGTFACPASP